jgi:hypothetical protein
MPGTSSPPAVWIVVICCHAPVVKIAPLASIRRAAIGEPRDPIEEAIFSASLVSRRLFRGGLAGCPQVTDHGAPGDIRSRYALGRRNDIDTRDQFRRGAERDDAALLRLLFSCFGYVPLRRTLFSIAAALPSD